MRHFANGEVLVNPTDTARDLDLGGTYEQVLPNGDGTVADDGSTSSTLDTQEVTGLTLQPHQAAILLVPLPAS